MKLGAESKRVRKFRLSIAKAIPKFPNTKETLEVLEAKDLASLLIDYANWMIRYVTPRPRAVSVEPTASNDPRWQSLSKEITAFLDKVVKGDSLAPYLSLQTHTRGFTPAASALGPHGNRWADKDILLNAMGFHHFHLKPSVGPEGVVKPTNEVLFAAVTREQFEVVGIFDHSVFVVNSDPREAMSSERKRLWEILDERATRVVPPGTVVVPILIAMSGHPVYLVHLAQEYARVIRKIDPELNDPAYVRSLYEKAGFPIPPKPKLVWHFRHLDLGLLDEVQRLFIVYRYGPN